MKEEPRQVRPVPDVCSEVYRFCQDDVVVAAFLSTVITGELTDPDEDIYRHIKVYSEALDDALKGVTT